MIKILLSEEIKKLDAYTIQHEPISSFSLMQRAATVFVKKFIVQFPNVKHITVVCGGGNNGGDGLIAARLLAEKGYYVTVDHLVDKQKQTDDNRLAFTFCSQNDQVKINKITELSEESFNTSQVIIDALFGSGLSRPLSGLHAEIIAKMNDVQSYRIALDISSGLLADSPSQGEIFKAHYTFTFQLPKKAFLIPENAQYTGQWSILDIGLSSDYINQAKTDYYMLEAKDIRRQFNRRNQFDHKGKFGHALLVAGSYGKMGAAVLASRATIRVGSGLVTTHVPSEGNTILQATVPEVMISSDVHPNYVTKYPNETYSSIGVGPGLGMATSTIEALSQMLKNYQQPIVIDADALNIIARHPNIGNHIFPGSVLTPHVRELQRLVGESENGFDRLKKAKILVDKFSSILVLKGAYSAIVCPGGEIFFNPTGNPYMATAGSGDVLTGMITGLMAQGYPGKEAACIAVYTHGASGDYILKKRGVPLIATDIVEHIPKTFRMLNLA